jgi:hypothetical protein
MSDPKKSVIGIATTLGQAESLINRLRNQEGVAESEISVIAPDTAGTHDVGHIKATKAPEGATTGALSGGTVGGVVGLLAGLGALAIPGVGPLIAAGPIMAALSGIAAGGAAGGLIGGLVGLGIPELEAKVYQDKLEKGNYMIGAHPLDSDQKSRIEDAFKEEGLENVCTVGESKA